MQLTMSKKQHNNHNNHGKNANHSKPQRKLKTDFSLWSSDQISLLEQLRAKLASEETTEVDKNSKVIIQPSKK